MRILHISTRLILGGSQENTVLSCEGQASLGHDVHLAFGPIYGPEGSLLERVAAFKTSDGRGITTHVVPDMVREINLRRDRRALLQLRELIRGLAPDVVHTHSSKAGILGRWAAWDVRSEMARAGRPGPRVIHTIHGPPFMPVEGGAIRRAKINLSNHLYTLAERFAARRCDRIVSVADAMTEQFLARGIGAPALYTTVRSGMEVEPYLAAREGEERDAVRASLGIAPSDFVIGTVARLAEHKGHDDLIDALRDNLRADPSWKLLWVGDGWWRERLEARLRSLGIERSVMMTGLVPPTRIPSLMRTMDVLAHPSSREGLPRTVPQALLTGVTTVAYDVDGTREACIDGVTGRLVKAGDAAGLRHAIVWMHEHPAERRKMGEDGRELCRDQFSAARMVSELEKVYAREGE